MNFLKVACMFCLGISVAFNSHSCQPPAAVCATSKIIKTKIGEMFSLEATGPKARYHISENIENDGCLLETTKQHTQHYEMGPCSTHQCVFKAIKRGHAYLILSFDQFCHHCHKQYHITSAHFHIFVS